MSLNKKSVDDINVKGRRVLVRCDFNVPLKEGKITWCHGPVRYHDATDDRIGRRNTTRRTGA